MPKHNYRHEKRQKELNRQRKKEEKAQRKLDRAGARPEGPETADGSSPELPPAE